MSTQTFNTSGTWTCPTSVTTVDVQVWGAGATGDASSGEGGGGGAYAETTNVAVTPGNNYTVTVDTSNGGNFSQFVGDSTTVKADSASGSSGGAAASSIGGTTHDGGNGGGPTFNPGAGGGGSAGAGGAGGTGGGGTTSVGGTGGTAGSGTPAGAAGGAGGSWHSGTGQPGSNGVAPGSGGGGPGAGNSTPGTGAVGRIVLNWTVAVTGSLAASFSATAIGSTAIPGAGGLTASFSATAAGIVTYPGTASLVATFSGVAAGTLALNAMGTLAAGFSAAAVGVPGVQGTLVASFSATAVGILTVSATASLTASFSATAAGVVANVGQATLTASFSGTAAGSVAINGSGALAASFAGAAAGAVVSVPGHGTLVASFVGFAIGTQEGVAPVFPTPVLPQGIHGLSSQFIQAVTSDHQWAIQVQIFNSAGVFLQDLSDLVTGGSVTVDETAEIRRTCSLTLAGTPDMVPATASDLLHPATGNEIKIWRGVKYENGQTEFAQLGVFRMTKPNITDDGASVTITVNGQDRASVLARIAWQIPYTVSAGSNIGGAIAAAVSSQLTLGSSNAIPNLQFNFQSVSFTYPPTTFGGSPGSPTDPMSDLITFAATAGCELFFDVFGVMTFRPIVNPLGLAILDSIHFVEGENCTMDGVGRVLDESTAYNGVVLYCNGTGDAGPFTVTAWDTNPGSPTYYLGPWGQVPYVITTTAFPASTQTLSQAKVAASAMAFAQLQLVLGSFDDINLTTMPNPALREGDCVQVVRQRMKINNNYVISGMTIPLDPQSPESITFRPRISAR